MLNADDPETILSLRLLKDTVEAPARPLVFWIGAGASRWLGYPSWMDLALQLRKVFFRSVDSFDNQRAVELVNKENFPAVFQMCRDLDSQTYYRFVADTFSPRMDAPLFRTFVDLLQKLSPLFILTTNVDEALESRPALSATVRRSDRRRCDDLLRKRVPLWQNCTVCGGACKAVLRESDGDQPARAPRTCSARIHREALDSYFPGLRVRDSRSWS